LPNTDLATPLINSAIRMAGKLSCTSAIRMIKPSTAPSKKTYTQVFGEWLCDAAELDSRVVGITPAMREGSGLVEFEKRFPDRYFDVGIAEQHAVTFAGGLAADGMKPVVAIYSTFLQRAYDQLIHDVALQNLPVVFAIDRAGLVGADGATHAGAYDLAFLRCIPNMTVMAASDENECRQMLHTALQQPNPTAVRYPRGAGSGVSAGERECKRLALARGLVFGRLRVDIRIILCALLIRVAAAPVGVGQAARKILMRLPSDLARTFFMLRFRGLVSLVRQW